MSELPEDARTVSVRIQVVDLSPRVIDLDVPAYLPARDLTQRIARDAGLGAFWPGGRRRLFWLRARGRVVEPDETLADLQVIDNELLHLLPEPPADGEVHERPLGLEAAEPVPWTWWSWAWRVVASVAWTLVWVAVLRERAELWVGALPSAALASAWTFGLGHRVRDPANARVAAEGVLAWTPFAAVALLAVFFSEPACEDIVTEWRLFVPAARPCVGVVEGLIAVVVGGLFGVGWGWLATQRVLPPLPLGVAHLAVADAHAPAAPCGVCERSVAGDKQVPCPHGCALVFHQGCLQHRMAIAPPGGSCAMCGAVLE